MMEDLTLVEEEFPEMEELKQQMASLEQRITTFKQEVVEEEEEGTWENKEEDDDQSRIDSFRIPGKDDASFKIPKTEPCDTKWGKPIYQTDPSLPLGWKYFSNNKGSTFFKDAGGKFIKNRRNALSEMYLRGGFRKEEIQYIRDGLVTEGWRYHWDLPLAWMFKQYSHKIEGVDTDVLYLLSPSGSIFRSKKKIKKNSSELELSEDDLAKLLSFRPDEFDDPKILEKPDENWIYDEKSVPVGWKMKKYTYNSNFNKRVEEVFHYLTPDKRIVRGKKQVYDWMLKTGTYNSEDFSKFPFNKKDVRRSEKQTRPSQVEWTQWRMDSGLPKGWMVRDGQYKYQKKVQYKSPGDRVFLSRAKVLRFLSDENSEFVDDKKLIRKRGGGRSASDSSRTIWDDWRDDDIPCLPGWQFSIGRKDSRRKIRYKSPCGKVFQSRGPLIRYLHENNIKGKQQLVALKKLLKTNQVKTFEELRTNDRFIKNFEVDWNYLLFLKIRYDNHEEVAEVTDAKLPEDWRKKEINGVEYFRDPSGKFVFNSRKLVVDHLRKHNYELSDEDLLAILEDSDSESDLSESEDEETDSEDDGNMNETVVKTEREDSSGYSEDAAFNVKNEIESAEFLIAADGILDDSFMTF